MALDWERKLAKEQRALVTSEYVLFEIADGLSAMRFRRQAAATIAALRTSPFVELMNQNGLVEALTADDHFRQAGFRALMLEEP